MTRAAQIMWEADCGCVPVVDDDGKPIAVVTDRDLCMAAYTRGQSLSSMSVSTAASRRLISVRQDAEIATAEHLMREYRVRRLPVVSSDGRLVGILSVNDLARRVQDGRPRNDLSSEGVVMTLAEICTPSAPNTALH
jgi:CBS domain-containing protein